MIDPCVQDLLRQAIDSPTKLHLLLIFHEHATQEVTPNFMAERACRDIWSVSQALNELAQDGILHKEQVAGEAIYYYRPRAEFIDSIHSLISDYNDPLQRDKLRRSIRELAEQAPLRRPEPHSYVL
jgi:predicted transcriptional regulator